MVKLFCMVVGETGSAFAIDIDENDCVDELKDAIKADNEKTITCDACKLQLFLAKNIDGTFIHYSDVDALSLDKNGCSKGFTSMIPLQWIKFYFGENFQPNAEEIHVLVVVPSIGCRSKARYEIFTNG